MTEHHGFGDVLRAHRRKARLTLEQLAEASSVSARTLSDMERGRSRGPQHRTVTAVADALGLDAGARQRLIELARAGRLRDHWSRPSGLCELPGTVDDFTGRGAELIWMSELLYAESSPGVGVVGLVTGSAGLGKTSFAVRAAHSVRQSFPGGVFFIDLFGISQRPAGAGDTLRMLLRAFGVADQHIPGDTQERAALYRSLLRDKRVLVVLDNAASEEQVRPLLPGGGAGRVVITTRRLLAGLEGVHRLVLGPLPVPQSMQLLTGILGERAASDDETALTRIAELCGGLPLALRIIGNRLVSRPAWDVAELAGRLADEESRLHQFTAGDLKIANAFGMSYEQLAERAKRLFRRLAAVPGRDFDAALAAVAGGMPIEDAWQALDDLVDLGLLQDGTAGRYRFHDLVRLFARDRLQNEEAPPGREAVTATVTSWLLRMATTAGRWFEPGYGRPDGPDPDLTSLATEEEAEQWLRGNVDNWLAAMRSAAGQGLHELVLNCAESMHWFSDRWLHGPHWGEVFTLGAQAAAALDDLAAQATQLNYLAWVHSVPPSDPQTVLSYTAQALELATRGGARTQIAWSHQYSNAALSKLGRHDEAIAAATQAAQTFKALGDIDSHAQGLVGVGNCLRDQGRHSEALRQYVEIRALADDEKSGMTPRIAALSRPVVGIRIGQCLAVLGRRTEAVTALNEAIDLLDGLRISNFWLAQALEEVAALHAQDGRTDQSHHAYARAAEVYASTGDGEAHDRCRTLAAAGA
ncbi:helix-turn-helix domain-containing protein [Streptomyces sp. NPDC058686]|uniref:helix-turn-helix domain-containing protein n=1 Tax=Streptomyces sp. NPDC058686 TaxID=3346599 RepID=UPI00366057A9